MQNGWSRRTPWLVVAAVASISTTAWAVEDVDHPPIKSALEIQLIRPDLQGIRVIELFEDHDYPHPAAALAAWKRLGGERSPRTLGKPLEAAIAALNPLMVRELRLLNQARFVIDFNEQGELTWWAMFPEDDGTLSALAEALAMTEGGPEPPIEGVPVDRLGPPGAVLVAKAEKTILLAGSWPAMTEALERVADPKNFEDVKERADTREIQSGWRLRLDPHGLARSNSLEIRQFAEGVLGFGGQSIEAVAKLEEESLSVIIDSRFHPIPPAHRVGAINPEWFDWVPTQGLAGAITIRLDPSEEAWAATFAAADRIDRMDPRKAEVAPIRTRINLIAMVAGIRPEIELWPRLEGMTLGVSFDENSGNLNGILVALHAQEENAAKQIAERVIPRLAAAIGGLPEANSVQLDHDLESRLIGQLSGRPLQLARQETTVLTTWGFDLLSRSLAARRDPQQSIGPAMRGTWGDAKPTRAGAIWPGRWPDLFSSDTALVKALNEAPPVIWWGEIEGETARDQIRWEGLQETIRRMLDTLPIEPISREE